jgi:ribosome-binding factor A
MTSKKPHTRAPRRRSAEPHAQQQFLAHHLRLQTTLTEELAFLFRTLSDPTLEDAHVTSLALSDDGRNVRVGYTLPPGADAARAAAAFARATPYLRSQLAAGLNLKRVPRLRFVLLGVAPTTPPPEDRAGPPADATWDDSWDEETADDTTDDGEGAR